MSPFLLLLLFTSEGWGVESLLSAPFPRPFTLTSQPSNYLLRKLQGGPGVLFRQSSFYLSVYPAPNSLPLSLCARTSSCTGHHSFHQLSQPFPTQSQSASLRNRHWALIWHHSPRWPASYLVAGGLQRLLPSWKRQPTGKDTGSKYGFASTAINGQVEHFIHHHGVLWWHRFCQAGAHFSAKKCGNGPCSWNPLVTNVPTALHHWWVEGKRPFEDQ